jgi:hypothetical protein
LRLQKAQLDALQTLLDYQTRWNQASVRASIELRRELSFAEEDLVKVEQVLSTAGQRNADELRNRVAELEEALNRQQTG